MKKGYLRSIFASILIISMLATLLIGIVPVSASDEVDPFANSVFKNYITREGSILYDGDEPFRTSVGLAGGNLFCPEDGGYHFADEFEMRDMFETMLQLGQTATRTGWFSFKPLDGTNHQSVATQELEWMVEGAGKYNEEGFRAMDKMLQLANEYGVRLFIPIFADAETIASYRGKKGSDTYKDLQLIEDVKSLFTYTLNRTNYYTGVKYKDDPAVLAWQIGNELDRSGCTTEWTNIMSAHIKSIDKNHLVAAPQTFYWKDVLDDPNIDIVDTHIYDAMPFKDMIQADLTMVRGKKTLILGELGMQTGEFFAELLPWISEQPEIFGAYLFMMSSHNTLGGIYCHSAYSDYPNLFWPGYDEEPDNGLGGTGTEGKWDLNLIFKTIRELNYGKMGIPVPEIPKPKAPHLLPVTDVHKIWWRGSVGARYYDIERAESNKGPWTVIGENIQDYKQPRNENISSSSGQNFGALFDDKTAEDGKTYFYRVKAKTPAGVESDYSNIRFSGDDRPDEILKRELKEKNAAKAAPQIVVDIPTVEGKLSGAGVEKYPNANFAPALKGQLGNAVVLKVGESTAFVNNTVRKIDAENENITPITKNGRTLVPVRFIAEAFDCNVAWDEGTQTVAILSGLYSSSMRIGENIITVKDQGYELDQPAELLDGERVVAPLRAICERSLSKKVIYKNDIIVIYEGDVVTGGDDPSFWSSLEDAFADPIAPETEVVPDQSSVKGNLFTNGGFETGDSDGWFALTPSDTVTSEEVHSGEYSLKAMGTGVWSGPSVRVNLETNTDYIVSFWAFASPALRGKYALGMNCKVVDNYTNVLSPTIDLAETEDWTRYTMEFNSGSVSEAMFRFALIWGGAYIDDFIMVPVDSDAGRKIKEELNAEKEVSRAENNGAVFIDECNDYSKLYKYNGSHWRLYEDSAAVWNNDVRLARSEGSQNAAADIIYKVENMKNFAADIGYCVDIAAKFYYSADGNEWTEFTAKETKYISKLNGDWEVSYFSSPVSFPDGTNYIKIEFTDGNSAFWTPQIKSVRIYDTELTEDMLNALAN